MSAARPGPRALALYFLQLGTIGFGGPIALVGYMQRDLVESRRWVTETEYKEGLALAQLAPGPLAAQLAMYLGWVCGGTSGATLTGAAFIAPSFLMVLALSTLYVHLGGLPWIERAFYGVGAAVIAVIARSAIRLVRMTLGRDRLLWALSTVSAAVTAWTGTEIVWLFLACGLVPVLVRTTQRLSTAASVAPLLAVVPALWSFGFIATIFWYFAGAGLFVFGSGLAIIPFLHGGVVQGFHWLTERQFLDAVAVSLITPGPVVITVAFIGYLTAGLWGACAAAAGVFLPVYLVTVLVAPSFRRGVRKARIKAFATFALLMATKRVPDAGGHTRGRARGCRARLAMMRPSESACIAGPMSVRFRLMTRDDIPAGMRLKDLAGWNQTALDWERFLRASPEGCVAAECEGQVVGTSATIVYEERFAWIGMVVVDPEHRGRGIGTTLLERAIQYLESRSVPAMKLDATPQGKPLYEKFGFVAEYDIERWMLARRRDGNATETASPGIEDVLRLDRDVFGADRGGLLRSLARGAPDFVLVARQEGAVAGYTFGRRGSRADHLGPWVARDEATAATLLDEFLRRSARELVYVDCVRQNPWPVVLLKARGFALSRPLTRMVRGKNQFPGRPELLGAILGPEFG